MPVLGQSLSSGGNFVEDANIVNGNSIPVIASAATVAPQNKFTRITGVVTITTITPPNGYFNGPVYLFNTDASVGAWDTSGNIALAGTMTRYVLFAFAFDGATSKWYPSAVA